MLRRFWTAWGTVILFALFAALAMAAEPSHSRTPATGASAAAPAATRAMSQRTPATGAPAAATQATRAPSSRTPAAGTSATVRHHPKPEEIFEHRLAEMRQPLPDELTQSTRTPFANPRVHRIAPDLIDLQGLS